MFPFSVEEFGQRYDPLSEDHEKFEIKTNDEADAGDTVANSDGKIGTSNEVMDSSEEPKVSKETFYTVSSSLKDLFGTSVRYVSLL